MPVNMTINGNTASLKPEGRFQFSTHREFRDRFAECLGKPEIRSIDIDFTKVEYIDSSALGTLLLCREQASTTGKTIALISPAGTVRQVLDIANFQKLFSIRP